ncbi:unnamed protein product, partial [Clonostachys rosea]
GQRRGHPRHGSQDQRLEHGRQWRRWWQRPAGSCRDHARCLPDAAPSDDHHPRPDWYLPARVAVWTHGCRHRRRRQGGQVSAPI